MSCQLLAGTNLPSKTFLIHSCFDPVVLCWWSTILAAVCTVASCYKIVLETGMLLCLSLEWLLSSSFQTSSYARSISLTINNFAKKWQGTRKILTYEFISMKGWKFILLCPYENGYYFHECAMKLVCYDAWCMIIYTCTRHYKKCIIVNDIFMKWLHFSCTCMKIYVMK